MEVAPKAISAGCQRHRKIDEPIAVEISTPCRYRPRRDRMLAHPTGAGERAAPHVDDFDFDSLEEVGGDGMQSRTGRAFAAIAHDPAADDDGRP
jgi:hypothetical protein